MSDLVLTRFCYAPGGTFGELYVDGRRLFTVERPWLGNLRSISCIPEGEYKCSPRRFYRGGYEAVEVRDVPGRTHILFHMANRPSDVAGCIGVGSTLGVINADWAVLHSKEAFDLFMRHWGGRNFSLRIQGPPPAVLSSGSHQNTHSKEEP